MKVLIISETYSAKENRKNIQALQTELEVECIIPKKIWSPLHKTYFSEEGQLLRNGVKSYPILNIYGSQFIFLSKDLGLKKFNPHIINVECNPWSLLFLQVLLYRWLFLKDAKLVCTVKKNTYESGRGIKKIIKNVLTKYTLKKVDHFICASRIASDLYINKLMVSMDKISISTHLGVDIDLFKPDITARRIKKNNDYSINIGYCGRFDADKGILDLLAAIESLNKNTANPIRLILLGDSAREQQTINQILNYQRRYKWLELRKSVPHESIPLFMHDLDLFVLPSIIKYDHQEHDAHVLLEAMACGVPCLGTKSGIITELLSSEPDCLVSPGHPEELACSINKLISNPGRLVELSKYLRKRAEREFSIETIAKNRISIYKEIMLTSGYHNEI